MSSMTQITSHAEVVTEDPGRYAKQLASHLGRKLAAEEDGDSTVLRFDGGWCRLTPAAGALLLHAEADSAEVLHRVEQVVGSHLERFGTRSELAVNWVR